MSSTTKHEVMKQLRRRYRTAGLEHKRKLTDQAVALLGYHRKAAIRALAAVPGARVGVSTGRPREYGALRRGLANATKTLFIGDGAAWV